MSTPVPAMAPLSGHRSVVARLLIVLLKAYRLVISPLYGNVCRYYPSCSAYALTAVQLHGAARGSWLAAKRLGRCHPWTRGGYDPVPGAEHSAPGDESSAGPQSVGVHGSVSEPTTSSRSTGAATRARPGQFEQNGRPAAGRGNGVN